MAFLGDLWPNGATWFLIGLVVSEFLGYAYHRWVLHAILLSIHRHDGGAARYLFVPWRLAYEKHMWHHFDVYPEPTAPGSPRKAFRPKFTFYNGEDIATHAYGREPSKNVTVDTIEFFLSKIGFVFSIDWLLYAGSAALVAWFLIGDVRTWIFFALGMAVNGAFNQTVHDGFHVKPHASLREVPFRDWLRPSTAFANLGAHLPGLRALYRWLFIRHVAHHYDIARPDDGNYRYEGLLLNKQRSNFTMYFVLPDYLFGSNCDRVFEEVR